MYTYICIHNHPQIFSLKVTFLFKMKLLIDAPITANNNDHSYGILDSTKEYTKANCKDAPNEQIIKKSKYCLIKCLGERSLSPKVHNLFNIKLEEIEIIIPIDVDSIYHSLACKPLERKTETK